MLVVGKVQSQGHVVVSHVQLVWLARVWCGSEHSRGPARRLVTCDEFIIRPIINHGARSRKIESIT